MRLSGDAVLIAAFSGRSLAQSARRAGFRPLVVDAFGDLDMREAAEDFRVLDGAMQSGFHTKPVVAALTELAQSSTTPPIGLVLGSGFEDKPRLVAALASRFRLLGPDAKTLAECKDPRSFFAVLDELSVPHPKTQIDAPSRDEALDWISKRVGGSGGRHIRDCTVRPKPKARARRYFQKRISGTRYSIGAMLDVPGKTDGSSSSFSPTRQWTAPSRKHPYRFGGCVSGPEIEEGILRELTNIAYSVSKKLNLAGSVSFDFIVRHGEPFLLEVNPRPGASLDVLDDANGAQFRQHVAAWTGTGISPNESEKRGCKAMAILHADRAPVILGNTPWPEWSADRGAPGTIVPEGSPLATVFAEAPTADAAEALARKRLAELGDLIYEHARSRSDRSAKW